MPQEIPGLRRPQGATPTADNPMIQGRDAALRGLRGFLSGVTGIGDEGDLTSEGATDAGAIGNLVGTFNPEKMMLAPLAGMTKFLRSGVPDVAARVASTDRNINSLIHALANSDVPIEDAKATVGLAKRYPRTMAHTQFQDAPLPEGRLGETRDRLSPGMTRMTIDLDPGKINRPIPRALGDLASHGPDPLPITERQVPATFAHELQHSAQALQDRMRFGRRYTEANNAIGYASNPYEIAANAGAAKRVLGADVTSQAAHARGLYEILFGGR